MMKTGFFLTAFFSVLMAGPAFAQTANEAVSDIPARISETVFVEAPDDHVLGSENAVQTMIVYASVTCPHCGSWFSDEFPKLRSELVETGTMRFVFRQFPTAPAELSLTGFMLAECAPSEDYFDVIQYQMENQKAIFDQVNAGQARQAYDTIAAKAGMDNPDAIGACLSNPDMFSHIEENSLRADLAKVRGVPAFFINGEPYGGPQDAQSLIDLITEMDEKGLTTLPAELVQSEAPARQGHNHD